MLFMFQKLYKHLEEMSASLRQQQAGTVDAKQLAGKISEQLETVKDSVLSQNELLLSQNKLSQEAYLQKKRGLAPVLQVVNLFLTCVGIVVIIIFSHYAFELSKITGRLVNSGAPASGQAAQAALSARQSCGSEEHFAKLDSLINEQGQAIKELKSLNTAAVRTFVRIRRHLDLMAGGAKAALLPADSISRGYPLAK
jgi:hypothetical protein